MKICLILLFLVACASGPKFDQIQSAARDKALVYVYRPTAFTGSVRSPNILVNKEKKGTSSNGSFFFFAAEPGLSKVVQSNFAGEEVGELEVQLKKGQIYFLRVDLSLPSLREAFNGSNQKTGKSCPFMGLNLTLTGHDEEIVKSMDQRVQTATCWPGFMFVTEDLAKKELVDTKLSK